VSWQKFSDRARESKKVRQSSCAAIVLWWAAGNYCSEHGTDGFVAKEDMKDVFRPIGRRFNHEVAARECVDSGLLIDHGTHFEVHDYLEYNPTREQVNERKAHDAKRAANYRARQKALKKIGAITRDDTRDDDGDDTGDERRESRDRHAPRTRDPVPSRPVPSEGEESARGAAAAPLALVPSEKPASKRDQDMTLLKATVKRLAAEYGHETTPSVSTKHLNEGLKKVRELAPKRESLAEAAEDIVRGAYERLEAGKSSSFGYALHDCAPAAPRPVSVPAQEAANDW
jgi:hypothetical protein